MTRLIVAALLVAVAAVAARILRGRQQPDAPTQQVFAAPVQLDRHDFDSPDAPWLVAVFSSATCTTCEDMVAKARVLATAQVAVCEVEVGRQADIHRKYAIDAVPITVVAGRDGVVHASFIGPTSATDLWAAVAEVREPGSSPEATRCSDPKNTAGGAAHEATR